MRSFRSRVETASAQWSKEVMRSSPVILRRLESLPKATLESSLVMLRERDVVRGARLELTPEFRSREKIAALADEVDQYLR